MPKKKSAKKNATSGTKPKSAAERSKKAVSKKTSTSRIAKKKATKKKSSAKKDVSSRDLTELKKQAKKVCRSLEKTYSDATCALLHKNPFELLVATILSAQCTDERVNMATPELFKKYPKAANLAKGKLEDVEKIVQPLGFFRAKAKNIVGMAQGLVEHHNGEVPEDLDALVKLPGVGRKTANVVLGTWFGIPTGVVVDTHVRRISNLLGLTESQNPEIIERDLMEIVPKKDWIDYSHRMIYHGRQICNARKPNCPECPMLKFCPRVGLPDLA